MSIRSSRDKRKAPVCFAGIALCLLAVGAVLAEEVVVQVQSLVVRSGKGSMFPPIAEVKNQEKLEIIERQADKWLKVKVGDQEGYVRETALVARKTGSLSGVVKGANVLTGNTSEVGASAAARGVGEDTAIYASTKGMNTDGLGMMIQSRDRVAGERWVKFTEEGKVGPAKQ